jgi:hypothetical protein
MGRILFVLVSSGWLAGCDSPEATRPEATRTVPITRSSAPTADVDTHAATRPPRAIATH